MPLMCISKLAWPGAWNVCARPIQTDRAASIMPSSTLAILPGSPGPYEHRQAANREVLAAQHTLPPALVLLWIDPAQLRKALRDEQ